ncbi:MAG TPA: hypothetical protein VEC19_00860 [Usitatibacter sp.]|nr:hypothetical protein [Usitatibacter sp.]
MNPPDPRRNPRPARATQVAAEDEHALAQQAEGLAAVLTRELEAWKAAKAAIAAAKKS